MKSLMKMFAKEDKGVVFYETVISLKWQRHTCIECVPLPWAQYDVIPQFFKVKCSYRFLVLENEIVHRNLYWHPKLNGLSIKKSLTFLHVPEDSVARWFPTYPTLWSNLITKVNVVTDMSSKALGNLPLWERKMVVSTKERKEVVNSPSGFMAAM